MMGGGGCPLEGGVLHVSGLGCGGTQLRNSRLWSAMSFGDTSSLQVRLVRTCAAFVCEVGVGMDGFVWAWVGGCMGLKV